MSADESFIASGGHEHGAITISTPVLSEPKIASIATFLQALMVHAKSLALTVFCSRAIPF